jgi:hypothetical protein
MATINFQPTDKSFSRPKGTTLPPSNFPISVFLEEFRKWGRGGVCFASLRLFSNCSLHWERGWDAS